jgi:hypothetical protein
VDSTIIGFKLQCRCVKLIEYLNQINHSLIYLFTHEHFFQITRRNAVLQLRSSIRHHAYNRARRLSSRLISTMRQELTCSCSPVLKGDDSRHSRIGSHLSSIGCQRVFQNVSKDTAQYSSIFQTINNSILITLWA